MQVPILQPTNTKATWEFNHIFTGVPPFSPGPKEPSPAAALALVQGLLRGNELEEKLIKKSYLVICRI